MFTITTKSQISKGYLNEETKQVLSCYSCITEIINPLTNNAVHTFIDPEANNLTPELFTTPP